MLPDIQIAADGLTLDGRTVAFPLPLATLTDMWGEPVRWPGRVSTVVTWPDLGIYAHLLGDDHAKTLCLQLLHEPSPRRFATPSLFTGTCRVDDADLTVVVPAAPRRGDGYTTTEVHGLRVHAKYAGDGNALEAVEIVSATRVHAPVPADKYLPRAAAEPLLFTDLNLKLAVVDELMYQQELIEPAFDLGEFVRWSDTHGDGLSIDLDAVGHGPVPDALAWFDRLEVDRSVAEQVEVLVIDAGNDVYQEIAPQWDGEDGLFDIGAWGDLDLLPRLRRIDFISLTPGRDVVAALRGRGLEVDA